ncbi:triose-phosphate isomerase [Candidatus Peregrinibacteria bacterium CG10_big_fil_rev_8_21_14_0_10_49_16]|nr:MAG: triose-phosphate isomerase [Candidatus Peregrinibacteria bacterium CG22_combo_CG10-13_8_21_14_all_49_11]PIR51798.1 MAG: triose-phosphate isomerase [Candidatus Peregrinibacteria bacterium CG10_big_fil_rev_8_21_14_0_10_49_16]
MVQTMYTLCMRRPLICANWKMHLPPAGWDAKDSPYRPEAGIDVVVFPPHGYIKHCIDAKLTVGGQCARPETAGAFTGDMSMAMLKELGCTYVLCGHSERRKYHSETDDFAAEQVIAALEAGLHPIVCVGEQKKDRDIGKAEHIVEQQLSLLKNYHQSITIAYEPIWAIGTGLNALPDDAQEVHAFMRRLLLEDIRTSVRIIYGGSVTGMNAKDFLSHPDIDGLLVGSCSLEPKHFHEIINAANTLS